MRRVFAIFILIGVGLASFLFFKEQEYLEVNFLNVGQVDSILIESPSGQNVLIDGGPDNQVVYELGRVLPFYDKTIDLMVLTHPHADHVTGLIEVLQRYQVKNILYTGVLHSAPAYLRWLEAIEDENISLKIVSGGQKINLGENSYLEILWPRNDLFNKELANLNNTSIVAKLVYGENSFLFTGDIEGETEAELLRTGIDLRADVLKIAHHGSDTSSSLDFLEAVSPEAAVMTFGDNNFGFPSPSVTKRLKDRDIRLFMTDQNRVTIESDGHFLSVDKE